MCIAAIAIGQDPRFPWVLLSNRDEFFHRPAQPLDWWQPSADGPRILSGRDLSAGGTWLGLNEVGQLALLTNVREPGVRLPASPSRGEIVSDWLTGRRGDQRLEDLAAMPRNGFNLLTADLSSDPRASSLAPSAAWLSNRPTSRVSTLGPGLYGLSNAALDTPWPKLQTLKQGLQQALLTADSWQTLVAEGLAALADRAPAPADKLVNTGLPHERERQLSSVFVPVIGERADQDYGTRCSTVVVIERAGPDRWAHVTERTFSRDGELVGDRHFTHRLP